MKKKSWIAAVLTIIILTACDGGTTTSADLVCPTTLITDPRGSWWITNSRFGGDVEQITLEATFRLANLGGGRGVL